MAIGDVYPSGALQPIATMLPSYHLIMVYSMLFLSELIVPYLLFSPVQYRCFVALVPRSSHLLPNLNRFFC
jgi:hypothetical protein